MTDLCIINGSPKKERSNSHYLADELVKLLDKKVNSKEYYIGNIMKDHSILDSIVSCKSIIFVSPLYADCLPSTMLDFMSAFEDFVKTKSNIKPHMYCIINCGFFEGIQNKIAINIMENYCKRLGFNWRFGIGVGGGEFIGGSKNLPLDSKMKRPVYDAFLTLKNDIEENSDKKAENIFVSPNMPEFIYKFAGNMGWKTQAKKNGLKPKELYKKIY